jgi:putative ABC transport system ATP-binding protein
VIELVRVCRDYEVGGRPVHALKDIDLSVPDGDYLSIMGPSGSGKSTLLNILGCLDRPTSGSYLFDGREVAGLTDDELSLLRQKRIGFVFQAYHLVPRLTAQQNVELPMLFAGIERAERTTRAAQALKVVGLSERAEHTAEQLSGGERQRVAIARAVVMGPSVLLADEPTGNLDTAAGGEVLHLLEKMNADGLTLLLVTHDPALGRRARHRLRLVDGVKAEEEKP